MLSSSVEFLFYRLESVSYGWVVTIARTAGSVRNPGCRIGNPSRWNRPAGKRRLHLFELGNQTVELVDHRADRTGIAQVHSGLGQLLHRVVVSAG